MSFASKLRRDAASKNMHSKMCSGLYNLAFDVRLDCKGVARTGEMNFRNTGEYFDFCPPEEDLRAFMELLRTLLDGCVVRVDVSPAELHWKKDGPVFVSVVVDWSEGSAEERSSLSMPTEPVLTPAERYEAEQGPLDQPKPSEKPVAPGTPNPRVALPKRTVAETLAGAKRP